MCELTVIVATYCPTKEMIIATLDSIIKQKGIELEIIVTDDGSPENYFDELRQYFKNASFSNYFLLEHKENQGTVKNVLDAIKLAKGEYVKLIGQGDLLYRENTLNNWLNKLKCSGLSWSFGDAIYFRLDDNNGKVPVEHIAYPVDIDIYRKRKWDSCRWNYLALVDNCLGAAVLINTKIAIEYLEKISGNVVYSEDLMYFLIMYDEKYPYYYDDYVVLYEFGSGISTSKSSKWNKILKDEYRVMYKMIVENNKFCDKQSKKIVRACRIRLITNDLERLIKSFAIHGIIKINIMRMIKARKTPIKFE